MDMHVFCVTNDCMFSVHIQHQLKSPKQRRNLKLETYWKKNYTKPNQKIVIVKIFIGLLSKLCDCIY